MSEGPTFAKKADELWRDEMAGLSAAVTPRIEVFRAMTRDMFRVEVAAMLDRLGHHVVSSAGDIVTEKGGQKFIVPCAIPTDTTPTGTAAVRRLHDAVVANSAARGVYVTPRSFSPEAEHCAASAPIDLIDGQLLIVADPGFDRRAHRPDRRAAARRAQRFRATGNGRRAALCGRAIGNHCHCRRNLRSRAYRAIAYMLIANLLSLW